MKKKIVAVFVTMSLISLMFANVLVSRSSNQQSNLSVKLFGSIATAAPEYDSNYRYQTMAYCGWSINYACCKHYTAESCRLYACLVN